MRKKPIIVLATLALFARFGAAQVPVGFSWINLETDQKAMAEVRRALRDPTMTAIREVGVESGFALVMTASREADAPTPDYDRWTIYNIALSTGKSQVLVSGYGAKLIDWIGKDKDELTITYYDCWGCEAGTLFTTLYFSKNTGWTA